MTIKTNQSPFEAATNSTNMQFAINMSQSRRSKTILSPDNATAKFLYSILKQLDLKSIDWNQVAEEHDISNGHAARMRYSRFKTQIEGLMGISQPKHRHGGAAAKGKPKENRKRKHDEFNDNGYQSSEMFYDHEEPNKYFRSMTTGFLPQNANSRPFKLEHGTQIDHLGSSKVKTEQSPSQLSHQHRPKSEIDSEVLSSNRHSNENSAMSIMQSQPDVNGSIKTEASHNVARHQPHWQSNSTMRALPYARSLNQFPYPVPTVTREENEYPTEWTRSTYNPYSQLYPNQNHHYPIMNQFSPKYQVPLPMVNYTNAFDLAARDSYPWPPSEASIPKYLGTAFYATNPKDTLEIADHIGKNNVEEMPSGQDIKVVKTSPDISVSTIAMPETESSLSSIIIDDATKLLHLSASADENSKARSVTSQCLPGSCDAQKTEHKLSVHDSEQPIPLTKVTGSVNPEHELGKEHEPIVIKLESETEIL